MKDIFNLRAKPELQFTLNNQDFTIVDASDPKNNGSYLYADLEDIELKTEQTNWIFSIFTHAVDILLSSAMGGNFKTKANLKLKFKSRTLRIWLIDVDIKNAEKVTHILKRKIKPLQNQNFKTSKDLNNKHPNKPSQEVRLEPGKIHTVYAPDFDNKKAYKVTEWRVQTGSLVKAGDIVCEIEYDNAVMEFESFCAGKIIAICNANQRHSVEVELFKIEVF